MVGHFKRALQIACMSQIAAVVCVLTNPASAEVPVYKDSAGHVLGFEPDPQKTEGTTCSFKQTNQDGEVKEATVYLDPATIGKLQIKNSDVVYQFETEGRSFLMKDSKKDASISLHMNAGQMTEQMRNGYADLINRNFSQLSLDLIERCQILTTVSGMPSAGSALQLG